MTTTPRLRLLAFRERTELAGALAVLTAALLLVPASEASGGTSSGAGTPRALMGWEHERPARGVDLYSGTLRSSGTARWTVTVRADGAQLLDRSEADEAAGELRAAKFTPRTDRIEWPQGSADRKGTLGVRVRVGHHSSQKEAEAERQALTDAGFDAVTEWTGGDGATDGGLARVKVAVVDPRRFKGSLGSDYGVAASGRETVTAMSVRAGALLGVNAGFFVMDEPDGIPGAAAGVAARNGELQSAATNGRIAAVLHGDGLRPQLRHLRTELSVRSGGASTTVDGINRKPGLVRNCGGVGGDRPTGLPRHDVTCTDTDELVHFTDELGASTPKGEGVESVMDRTGRVVQLRARGGKVPAGGDVLAGTGEGASWLREHAGLGTAPTLKERITDQHGRTVRIGAEDDIVNGGPQLVSEGQVAVDFGADGIDRPGDPSTPYSWGLKRNPRTALGVDGGGRVLLVTAEGRQPGRSDGLSVTQTAQLMKALGAVEAMNLDGGGSTAMTLDGELITRPSDPTGERPVGDALMLKP
jgi:exopolysaccharide biosynthesis protein